MFLVNPEMVDINIGTAGLVALTGYLVVFIGDVYKRQRYTLAGGKMP